MDLPVVGSFAADLVLFVTLVVAQVEREVRDASHINQTLAV